MKLHIKVIGQDWTKLNNQFGPLRPPDPPKVGLRPPGTCYGIPWYTMVYHGIPWYTMVWYTMVYHGIPWYTMEYHGIPWNTMEYHGIPMEYHGNTMEYHGIPWVPWNTTEYHGIPHGTMMACPWRPEADFWGVWGAEPPSIRGVWGAEPPSKKL